MATISLSQLDWTLQGWRPFAWRLSKRIENQQAGVADIGPLSARIPASAQQLLLEAGVIQDWNIGMNSLACEWVENRHWDFSARIPADLLPTDQPIILDAPGLDYAGWILVDCVEAARFEGALLPHRFDLTQALGDGNEHLLSIVFEEAPREQGQIGYTSLSRYFKPRYNYSWDWCPRIVPVGPWAPMTLLTDTDALCNLVSVYAVLSDDNTTGFVEAQLQCDATQAASSFRLELHDGNTILASTTTTTVRGTVHLQTEPCSVEPWWPNGAGAQRLYEITLTALDAAGSVCWQETRCVGFRRIEWQPCENAPADAEPWLCVVNDVPVFLQGANWVPPKAIYHDTTRADYERLTRLYQDMGANVLRVWGGGILETHDFYDLCDRAGILVWQELPLSSSGVENCPPDTPEAIEQLTCIARSYVQRRAHHASLLLWSGGNELTWGGPEEKTGILPVDEQHPCIAALRDTLATCDPAHRFVATSPTGPRFCADANEYGKGMHHDIHGPWGLGGFAGNTFEERLEKWREYWSKDDSLFRSETGMPGAASPECIALYADADLVWPPHGHYWMHTAAWWTQWDLCRKDMESITDKRIGIDAYIKETQARQAEAYGFAAKICKDRFPKCGGFIIWMGHDCFPCPANNSVIDFLCKPKPAYFALQEIFNSNTD